MTPFEQHHKNDICGLRWIGDFGWLRPAELGALLWPGADHARKQAERLVRTWLKRGLVLQRELPDRAGRAIVLAVAGVRLLATAGIEARSGKDIGTAGNGKWLPPLTWRHDLLGAQVLVDLYRKGFDIVPEPALRRATAGALGKIPDGLALRGRETVLIEIESSRKTGPAMRHLAKVLCAAGTAQRLELLGRKVTHTIVGFAENREDERGHKLDHRARVTAAVAATARQDVPTTWAICSMRGPNVETIRYEHDSIEADRASAVLKIINAGGWVRVPKGLVGHYGGKRVCVTDDDGGWCWEAGGQRGMAPTLTAAKRAASGALSVRPSEMNGVAN